MIQKKNTIPKSQEKKIKIHKSCKLFLGNYAGTGVHLSVKSCRTVAYTKKGQSLKGIPLEILNMDLYKKSAVLLTESITLLKKVLLVW